ncbi:MAG: hypothetical protein ACFFCW_49770 [Candidatus Hodarchaeota archaeon]
MINGWKGDYGIRPYDFLTRIWRDRTPMGRKSEEALFVKSDEMKMTPNDIESR